MDDADSLSDADVQGSIKRIHANVLNSELEKEVEGAFALFDKDKNGLLDLFECQAAFRALRLGARRDTVKAMFAELNKTEEESLTVSDFKTLVLKVIHKRYNSREAAKIFALLADDNGVITVQSLAQAVKRIGSSPGEEDLPLMISEASGGKDHVTFEEFKKILKLSWRGDAAEFL